MPIYNPLTGATEATDQAGTLKLVAEAIADVDLAAGVEFGVDGLDLDADQIYKFSAKIHVVNSNARLFIGVKNNSPIFSGFRVSMGTIESRSGAEMFGTGGSETFIEGTITKDANNQPIFILNGADRSSGKYWQGTSLWSTAGNMSRFGFADAISGMVVKAGSYIRVYKQV